MTIEDFAGRTAVITGAASGIGLALARALAARNAKLVLADIEAAALDDAVAELSDAGAEVAGVRVDVARREQITALAAAASDLFGKVHLLVNNAGVCTTGFAEEQSDAQWDWVMDVNLNSVIWGCRTFLPAMKAHGEPAHIVNTASMAGMSGGPLMAPYFATKFGVVGLSEALWHESSISGSNVGVSVLCPAFVRTGIAESDRNRPDGVDGWVTAGSELGAQFAQFLKTGVEDGIDPAAVAQIVLSAIGENRLWVLTHPDSAESIRRRAESIIGDGRPSIALPDERTIVLD